MTKQEIIEKYKEIIYADYIDVERRYIEEGSYEKEVYDVLEEVLKYLEG